jgi:membrane peptidoglycan carboxypeptidase
VAAKTGTTNEFRDGWTIGYTPSLAVGVWAGNNNNAAMVTGADGVNVAAPIWRTFLDQVLTNYAIEDFPKYNPDDEIGDGDGKTNKPMLAGKLEKEENLKVCSIPGDKGNYCLANKYCPDSEADKKDFVSAHDILFYVNRDDPRGPIPDKPEVDPQFKNWEKGVLDWYKKEKHSTLGSPPTDECKESDFKKYQPSISLSIPGSASVSSSITLGATVNAPYGVDAITFSVNGSTLSSSSATSVAYTTPASPTTLTVEVKIKDNNGNTAGASKTINIIP